MILFTYIHLNFKDRFQCPRSFWFYVSAIVVGTVVATMIVGTAGVELCQAQSSAKSTSRYSLAGGKVVKTCEIRD